MDQTKNPVKLQAESSDKFHQQSQKSNRFQAKNKPKEYQKKKR
jgi:hypothetical protein